MGTRTHVSGKRSSALDRVHKSVLALALSAALALGVVVAGPDSAVAWPAETPVAAADAEGVANAASDGAGAEAAADGTSNANAGVQADTAANAAAGATGAADVSGAAEAGSTSSATAVAQSAATGDANGTAADGADSAGSGADGTNGADDPSSVPVVEPTPDDVPRGPNGGVASDSPGPDTAKPWTGAASDQRGQAATAVASGRGVVLGDDYPAKYRNLPWPNNPNYIWDEWNFAYRQCTSFVAWRLNNANGVKFSNQYLGLWAWGNAGEWSDSAKKVGISVNKTPEVGAVAWSGPFYKDASGFGHVAWVAQVLDNGNVVIEEYNAGWAGSYGTRTVAADAFQGYIHVKDLIEPFATKKAPTIAGAAMAAGTLTANVSGWSPAPTTWNYQWLRNGVAISRATAKTYSPVLADVGAKLSVEVRGERSGRAPATMRSAATAAVLMPDLNGNGIEDTQELLPWNSDVNGDGLPDSVGFGANGPTVALRTSTGFGPVARWGTGFGTAAGWTSASDYPRTLVDINGDGKSDVVGFASDGVYVSLSSGKSFGTQKRWLAGLGSNGGFDVRYHPRGLTDVTGDGLPDVVAFASDGVYVAVNTGKAFAKATIWYSGFGTMKNWYTDTTPRFLTDMNGDGRADVVGISAAGVYVALSTGQKFATAKQWTSEFNSGAANWKSWLYPRTLADVNGDGLPDIVGFGPDGVEVMTNTGSGLRAKTRWVAGFGTKDGWKTGVHPRLLADVNGDGLADVIGFGNGGTQVALSTGRGFATAAQWSTEFGAADWRADLQPRQVTDVNGDGLTDVVGFSDAGVRVALSTGRGFAASQQQVASFGRSAGGWSVASHPRAVSVLTLAKRPTPTVQGSARVGEKLTASQGSWQPAPVTRKLQWLRDGNAISGATSASYTLLPADLGAKIAVRVSASKLGFAGVTRTSTKHAVAKGQLKAATPQISGTPKLGAKLTATAGAWAPAGVIHQYQWNRGGKPIAKATSVMYQVTRDDVGHRLTVTVTGAKTGYETATRTSAMARVQGTPLLPAASPFRDIKTGHKFYREIAWMSTSGLSTGVRQQGGKPLYQPLAAVSREAMAAFLFRLSAPVDYTPPTVSPFVDVPVNHKFYREIAWMSTSGLSTGVAAKGGRAYQPRVAVSREAMAAFLYRLEHAKTPAPAVSPFADMRSGDRFYREISWMSSHGLSTGVAVKAGRAYKPKDEVSREAMAAFLYRLDSTTH